MKSYFLLIRPLNNELMWFSLATGSGLVQVVTLSLLVLIGREWPVRQFMPLAVVIGALDAFTTGLYAALVLIATKFPEELNEPAGHVDARPPLEMRPRTARIKDLTGTNPAAA